MTIHRASGARGKADVLFSKIIRARAQCERCGESEYSKLECSLVMSRLYSATRTDTANAQCLCNSCHRFFTNNPVEFGFWIEASIGLDEYLRLRLKALKPRKFGKQFWESEVVRLKALLKEAA